MQYAAALIEYVITGLISLIWIVLLMNTHGDIQNVDYNKYKELIVIGIFPVAYISGIFVDVISSYILKQLGRVCRGLNEKVFYGAPFQKIFAVFRWIFIGDTKSKSYEKSAKILSYSTSDIIRTMETYVSRDRIARGLALNSLIAGIVVIFVYKGMHKQTIIYSCFTMAFVATLIRMRFLNLSNAFKKHALLNLGMRNSTHSE